MVKYHNNIFNDHNYRNWSLSHSNLILGFASPGYFKTWISQSGEKQTQNKTQTCFFRCKLNNFNHNLFLMITNFLLAHVKYFLNKEQKKHNIVFLDKNFFFQSKLTF